MLRVNYKIKYGEIKYRQKSDGKMFTIDIHPANALCAFIYHYMKDGEKWSQLISFFANEQHMKNCEKSWDGNSLQFLADCGTITSIKLNLYYKESNVLLKHFVKAGYKVTCYYKEVKEDKE